MRLPELDVIQTNYPHDVRTCFVKMITKWLEQGGTAAASLENLKAALTTMRKINLVHELNKLSK